MPETARGGKVHKDGEVERGIGSSTARRSGSLWKRALQPVGRGECMRRAGRGETVCGRQRERARRAAR